MFQQTLDNKILEVVESQITKTRKKANLSLSKSGLPVGSNFEFPFCNYTSKKNRQGSARISDLGEGLMFKCFSCGEARSVGE